jgi:hypothetical protein
MRFQLLVLILPFAATIALAQAPDDALQRAQVKGRAETRR